MSAGQHGVVITERERLSRWTNGMRTVFNTNLAQNYTVCINNNEYRCNKAVMHAALPSIPELQWEECFSTISNFSEDTNLIPLLLEYFYTCEMNVSMDTVKPILKACKVLTLEHLQEACQMFLLPNLCNQNDISWFLFSTHEHFDVITQECREAILKNLDKIRTEKEFQDLSMAEVKDLIRDQTEAGQSADNLFLAALSWMEKNDGQLLDFIDFSKCTKNTLELMTQPPYNAWELGLPAPLRSKLLEACLHAKSRTAEPQEKREPEKESVDCKASCCLDLKFLTMQKFAQSMIEAFQDFQNTNKHTDITVHLSSRDIQAHQVVLGAHAPYFEAFLRNCPEPEGIETDKMKANFDDLDCNAVSNLVDFMYGRDCTISGENLLEHIIACDFVGMETLLQECKTYAEHFMDISASNCFQWLHVHNAFNLPGIKKRAQAFICKNFLSLYHSEELLELNSDEILEVLNHPAFEAIFEKTVHDVIISWISYDQDARREYLPQLLKSQALRRSVACEDQDVAALLSVGIFSNTDLIQIWQTHYAIVHRVSCSLSILASIFTVKNVAY